jgi:hypothetical protein
VVTVDHQPDPLTRLRAAATAVSDLAVPGDGEQHDDGAGIDAAAHADRYDELHDALVAVLADVDRG